MSRLNAIAICSFSQSKAEEDKVPGWGMLPQSSNEVFQHHAVEKPMKPKTLGHNSHEHIPSHGEGWVTRGTWKRPVGQHAHPSAVLVCCTMPGC